MPPKKKADRKQRNNRFAEFILPHKVLFLNTPLYNTPHFNKTRLAPTPSGYLHLGNVFSFVLTMALAKRTGARVLLRIDDMDRERAAPQFVQDVFDTLNFLELPWNEGPQNAEDFEAAWSQQTRMPLYNEALQTLISSGRVFACTCSRTEVLKHSTDGGYPGTCRFKNLPLQLPGAALRIRTPSTLGLVLNTVNGPQTLTSLPSSLRDFVVRKKDGKPAYQLCSLVDDLHFEIDFVVRGADLWPSTVAQRWLASRLPANRFHQMVFLHHSLITDESGAKLSKSAGHTSVYGLRKAGFARQDVFALLGKTAGLAEPVTDWQSLATALLQRASVLNVPL